MHYAALALALLSVSNKLATDCLSSSVQILLSLKGKEIDFQRCFKRQTQQTRGHRTSQQQSTPPKIRKFNFLKDQTTGIAAIIRCYS